MEMEKKFAEFNEKMINNSVFGKPPFIVGSTMKAEVQVDGVDGNVLNFSSLNYLGLGSYDLILKKAAENIAIFGTGLGSSRTMVDSAELKDLEIKLAQFKKGKTALLCNTGYTAAQGVIKLLVGEIIVGKYRHRRPSVLVFVDKFTHASILTELDKIRKERKDGQVVIRKFNHLDYEQLFEIMRETQDFEGDRFIITDAVFSMNGSFANSQILLKLAKEFDARIIIDNAHSDGVYGERGMGVLNFQGIRDEDLKWFYEVGTLSKAFAQMGGYIIFPEDAVSNLAIVSLWPYVFSVGMPVHQAATASYVLDIAQSSEGDLRRARLSSLSEFFRNELRDRDFNILNSNSHIIPLVVGDDVKCQQAQKCLLYEHGILTQPVRYPAVKRNEALLRTSLIADLTFDHLERFICSIEKVRKKFDF